MGRLLRIALLLATLVAGSDAFAQQELSGPWEGKLAVDAKTTLTVRFTFSQHPDGTYAAVLDSPDNTAIKNVPVSAVSFIAGTLKLNVPALSGSYVGTLKDGKIDGHWTQPGGTLPLVLSAYQQPVLSRAAIGTLLGAWNGPILIPGVKATFLVRFRLNEKGEMTGALTVPEEPERGVGVVSDIAFADNTLEFKVPAPAGAFTYHGTYANGIFTGTWHQAGTPPPGLSLTLKKGDVASPVFALKLDSASFATIAGQWTGKLTSPRGSITIVMRFEVNGGGQYVGFIDSPDQSVKGIPIAEATVAAGKLMAKTNAPPAQFDGAISGKTITGQWTQQGPQGPVSTPLTLTRH
jgi:hypothetical protein